MLLLLIVAIVLGLAAFFFLRAIAGPIIVALAALYVLYALGGNLTAPLPSIGDALTGAPRPTYANGAWHYAKDGEP